MVTGTSRDAGVASDLHVGVAGPASPQMFADDLAVAVDALPVGLGGTPVNHLVRAWLDLGHRVTLATLDRSITPGADRDLPERSPDDRRRRVSKETPRPRRLRGRARRGANRPPGAPSRCRERALELRVRARRRGERPSDAGDRPRRAQGRLPEPTRRVPRGALGDAPPSAGAGVQGGLRLGLHARRDRSRALARRPDPPERDARRGVAASDPTATGPGATGLREREPRLRASEERVGVDRSVRGGSAPTPWCALASDRARLRSGRARRRVGARSGLGRGHRVLGPPPVREHARPGPQRGRARAPVARGDVRLHPDRGGERRHAGRGRARQRRRALGAGGRGGRRPRGRHLGDGGRGGDDARSPPTPTGGRRFANGRSRTVARASRPRRWRSSTFGSSPGSRAIVARSEARCDGSPATRQDR